MNALRIHPWPPVRAALGACALLLLLGSVVFAQVTRTSTVSLPKDGTRTITFQGATEADVTQAQTVLQQVTATGKMKALVEMEGRRVHLPPFSVSR